MGGIQMMTDDDNQPPVRLAGLATLPVRGASRWVSKIVTTNPPKYIPHEEYSLVFAFECSVPVLPVPILMDGPTGLFVKSWRSAAKCEWELHLAFMPYDWTTSDAIQICLVAGNIGGPRTQVEDPEFKKDPRRFVVPKIAEGRSVSTGCVLNLATITVGRGIAAKVIFVAKSDTDRRRGRWHLKQEFFPTLPQDLQFLASGDTTGTF
jgi:hypothetical protein